MTPFVVTSLRISAGVVVWAAHFALVYGATALACARGNARIAVWVVAFATLVAAAIAASIVVREWHRREAFEAWLAATLAGFAFVAILWEGLPILIVRPCQ